MWSRAQLLANKTRSVSARALPAGFPCRFGLRFTAPSTSCHICSSSSSKHAVSHVRNWEKSQRTAFCANSDLPVVASAEMSVPDGASPDYMDRTKTLAALPLLPMVKVGDDVRWLFESCVGVGAVKAGLPAISVQILWMAPMEVMVRIVKDKSVASLPLMPYSAMMTNGFVWTVYGALIGSSGVWVPNAIGCVFGAAYTAIFLRYCPVDANWLPGSRSAHILASCGLAGIAVAVALGLEHTIAVSFIGMMANILAVMMFAGPLAAMKTVIREQSTRSLPFGFTIVTVVNCALWIFYAHFILEDPVVLIPNVLGLLSGLVQLALFARFGIAR